MRLRSPTKLSPPHQLLTQVYCVQPNNRGAGRRKCRVIELEGLYFMITFARYGVDVVLSRHLSDSSGLSGS